jgi:hypothetical protein
MKQFLYSIWIFFLILKCTLCYSAPTQPIIISEITGFNHYPPVVKNLIQKAQLLSQMNLTYLYGSNDPKNKGMDCSGTIYYLLNEMKIPSAPRQSDELFSWAKQSGKLFATKSHSLSSDEFKYLKPGDLLFWSGTYPTQRTIPITHVMLYLGKNKKGEPLMFGASNGRTYEGKKMNGVGVFDFKLPKEGAPQKFVGYSCIPSLTCFF